MARSAEIPALPWLADYAVTPPVERCASPIQSVNNQCVRMRTGDGDLVWKVSSSAVRWLDGQESNFLAILTEAAM